MGPRIENKMILWTKDEQDTGASLVTKLINECEDMSDLSQILHVANELACQRNALLRALIIAQKIILSATNVPACNDPRYSQIADAIAIAKEKL